MSPSPRVPPVAGTVLAVSAATSVMLVVSSGGAVITTYLYYIISFSKVALDGG
jgi:hypothetical protein